MRYLHYKGNEYELLHIATHSETGEKLVVYRGLYDYGRVLIRPHDEFFGKVILNGVEVLRYAPVEERYTPCL